MLQRESGTTTRLDSDAQAWQISQAWAPVEEIQQEHHGEPILIFMSTPGKGETW